MRTVTSHAGDEIAVYRDEEFAVMAALESGAPEETARDRPGAFLGLGERRLGLLRSLWYEGAVEDRKSGFAVSALWRRAEKFGVEIPATPGGRSTVISQGSLALCLDREVRARKTYAIRLHALPERWLSAVLEWAPAPVEQEPAEDAGEAVLEAAPDTVEEVVEEAVSAPDPVAVAALEIEVANAVATALLTQVVEIISSGSGEDGRLLGVLRSEISSLEQRLGEQVAYVGGLRRQISQLGDEIGALKLERDGLRRRVKEVEHNLRVATSVDAQRVINGEVAKAVDRMMRQAPTARAEGDS